MSAQRLERLLGEPLAPAVAAHDAKALAALADALEAAMTRQRDGLDRAVDGAVRAVPRPLRPVVKRVLG